MALFNPEVRGINGSNVGTYSPPTVDYSGTLSNIGQGVAAGIADLFKASSRGGNVSESDKKALALRDVTSNLQRAFEIESATVRAVTVKNIQKNAILEYPQYREDIKGIFGELTGEIYQGTGVSPEQLEQANTYKWATSTSEGQAASAYANLKAGGDPILADNLIKESYLKDLMYKNQVATAENEVKLMEADDKKRQLTFSARVRPALQVKVDDYYATDTSPEMIGTLTQKAIAENIDVPTYLLDALTATREQRLAEVTNEINRMGLDPTSVKPESFMVGYDSAIKALTLNKDVITRSLQNKTEREKVQAVANLTNPFVREAAMKGNPIFLQQLITLDENTANEIKNLSKYSIGSAGGSLVPATSNSTLSDGSVGDSAIAFSQKYKGSAPEEELKKLFSTPPEGKRSLLKIGYDSLKYYQYDPNVPEKTEAAARNIGGMYVLSFPDIDTVGDGIKSKNVRNLLGNKAFSTIEAIKSTNPELGNDLYSKMNTYTVNAVNRLNILFKSNMDTMKFTEYDPFVLEMDKNGNISLNVNSDALREDINLKKAMGAYRYETKSVGRGSKTTAVETLPAETDPMKILNNYVSLLEMDNAKEVVDIIDSLKTIAVQARNIPADIRNRDYDPIELIKQNVSVIRN